MEELLKEAGEISSDLNTLSLVLIPYIIGAPSGKKHKGKFIKPSIAEQQEAFLSQLDDESKLQEAIETRRSRLLQLKLTMQPWIVYVGHYTKPTKVFIIVDDIIYIVESLVQAVDVTFKIFQATQALYPFECTNIWLLIQKGFYKIDTSHDGRSTVVSTVLNTLNLP